MRSTRTVTAIIAFVATFIFSAGLVRIIFGTPEVQTVYRYKPQCAERKASDIESFIRQDIRNGETRMERIHRETDSDDEFYSAEFADAVMEYSEASSSMDASRFPQDFQSAWRKHMKAWRDYANFLKETSSSKTTTGEEFFEKREDELNAEINRTWREVLSIGRSYGANVD